MSGRFASTSTAFGCMVWSLEALLVTSFISLFAKFSEGVVSVLLSFAGISEDVVSVHIYIEWNISVNNC